MVLTWGRTMKTIGQQRGMTGIGWLIVLGLLAFGVLVILRLAPVYLEYSKIASSIDSLEDEPQITQKSIPQIRKMLSRRFEINDVESISAKNAEIRIKQGVLTVDLKYEVRTHLAGNTDVVTMFHKDLELVGH